MSNICFTVTHRVDGNNQLEVYTEDKKSEMLNRVFTLLGNKVPIPLQNGNKKLAGLILDSKYEEVFSRGVWQQVEFHGEAHQNISVYLSKLM